MTLRVVHAGTGNTGRAGLKGVLHHPDLELVGQYVWSPAKVGIDAGDLCGEPATGIRATDDWARLLDLDADCLCWFGDSIGRADECFAANIRFLERGTNVVSFSGFELAHPASAPASLRDPVVAACRAGASSFYFSGIDPGWATTDLAIEALKAADRVDCIRVMELGYWGTYTAEKVCREYFGFGQPPGYEPELVRGDYLRRSWEPTLRLLAEALGVEIEGWASTHEIDCLEEDAEAGFGTIPAGTAAAVRFELLALAGGKPIAVVEHVDVVARGAGARWKAPFAPYDTVHRVEIEGEPALYVETGCPPGGAGPALRCAMPVVNAIPAVCAAEPGILTAHDLPRYATRNVRSRT
jgi:hypothetical protein